MAYGTFKKAEVDKLNKSFLKTIIQASCVHKPVSSYCCKPT